MGCVSTWWEGYQNEGGNFEHETLVLFAIDFTKLGCQRQFLVIKSWGFRGVYRGRRLMTPQHFFDGVMIAVCTYVMAVSIEAQANVYTIITGVSLNEHTIVTCVYTIIICIFIICHAGEFVACNHHGASGIKMVTGWK